MSLKESELDILWTHVGKEILPSPEFLFRTHKEMALHKCGSPRCELRTLLLKLRLIIGTWRSWKEISSPEPLVHRAGLGRAHWSPLWWCPGTVPGWPPRDRLQQRGQDLPAQTQEANRHTSRGY